MPSAGRAPIFPGEAKLLTWRVIPSGELVGSKCHTQGRGSLCSNGLGGMCESVRWGYALLWYLPSGTCCAFSGGCSVLNREIALERAAPVFPEGTVLMARTQIHPSLLCICSLAAGKAQGAIGLSESFIQLKERTSCELPGLSSLHLTCKAAHPHKWVQGCGCCCSDGANSPPFFPANVNSFLSCLEKKADANVHQVLSAV